MESLGLPKGSNAEFLGNCLNSSIGDFVVVHEPIEAFSCGSNVIGHDFAEAFVISDDKQIDHDDVAKLETIDEIRNAHLTECVEDDDGSAGVRLDEVVHLLQEDPGIFHLGHWEEDQLDRLCSMVRLQTAIQVIDGEDLHLVCAEVLEGDELSEEGLEHLDELIEINFEEVLDREDFGEKGGEEEFQFLLVLIGSGEDQEGLLLYRHHHLCITGVVALQVVNLALSKNEGLGLDSALLEGDPAGHVLDVLHNEIHRDAVVTESRDDDVCIDGSGQDEVAEGVLHELVVLLQHTDHTASTLCSVAFQPSAEADIV